MIWRFHHREETISTNVDARAGRPGDVYTADFQTAGRGRLDHVWHSPRGANLMMSVVLGVDGLSPEMVSTLPLVIGLAVCKAVKGMGLSAALKWPNDVLTGGRKLSGILCERHEDCVIAGIGLNVGIVPVGFEMTAVSLKELLEKAPSVTEVRDIVLAQIASAFDKWQQEGFAALYSEISTIDYLKGRSLEVFQTDADERPIAGVCGGIRLDGALDVGGVKVYAGEAHVRV